jgi:hypothetical protein
MPEYESRSRATAQQYDVAIAGGGITGITLALLLQQSGKRCVLMEANTIGFGTTGGTTAHLNTLLDTPYNTIIKNIGKANARLVSQAVREAIELIKNNIEEYNIDCGFKETKGYLFAQTDKQVEELQQIHDACNEVGVQAVFSNHIPVSVPFIKAMEVSR